MVDKGVPVVRGVADKGVAFAREMPATKTLVQDLVSCWQHPKPNNSPNPRE